MKTRAVPFPDCPLKYCSPPKLLYGLAELGGLARSEAEAVSSRGDCRRSPLAAVAQITAMRSNPDGCFLHSIHHPATRETTACWRRNTARYFDLTGSCFLQSCHATLQYWPTTELQRTASRVSPATSVYGPVSDSPAEVKVLK